MQVPPRLAERLDAPVPRGHVVCGGVRPGKVQRNGGKLHRGAPLQKQDPVVVRNPEQFTKSVDGPFGKLDEFLAAMTDFHHRHARSAPVEQFVPGALEDACRKRGRTRGEVVDAFHDLHNRALFRRK